MDLQRRALEDYQELHGRPTLQWMSRDTGISVGRLHRLRHGLVMKMSEYQVLRERIDRKRPPRRLTRVVMEIEGSFPAREIDEIHRLLERRLKLFSLTRRRT